MDPNKLITWLMCIWNLKKKVLISGGSVLKCLKYLSCEPVRQNVELKHIIVLLVMLIIRNNIKWKTKTKTKQKKIIPINTEGIALVQGVGIMSATVWVSLIRAVAQNRSAFGLPDSEISRSEEYRGQRN